MESITINIFNKELINRCFASGWNSNLADILTISTSEENQSLIKDFGRISLEDIKMQCTIYLHTKTGKT